MNSDIRQLLEAVKAGETSVDEAMLELAAERGIVLMSTQKTLYLSSGLLFTNGLQGG